MTVACWHAVVPFTFRIWVSHWTQEPSFEFLPAAPGIQQSASRRISLLGHPIPARGLGLPHGRLTGPNGSGPRRGYRVPHARAAAGVGASYTPRTAMLTRSTPRLRPAPAAFSAASPYTPLQHPISGASDNEASTKVYAIHPSGLPLACGLRMERAPLGFSPELRTPPTKSRRRTSGWGRALSTSPGQRSRHLPDLQSAHPLETCDLVSQPSTLIMPTHQPRKSL
jgi:hypothetical protein